MAFGLIALITFFASCKKDDSNAVAPPRDYTVQYASEKDSIEKYLKNHYIVSVDADYNVVFDSIDNPDTQVSIWDQTEYPLQNKIVTSTIETNTVNYTVYYLVFNQGVGDAPTRADNVLIAYRGTTFDEVQFDYAPFPTQTFSLASTIEGWQGIIPLFKSGTYIDIPNSPDPATYQDYGAGAMFLPSGLAYYNSPTSSLISAYEPLIFTFKLYKTEYVDSDLDGLLNKYEVGPDGDLNSLDTDGDGIFNYLDTDDDGDGYLTKLEITIPGTGTSLSNPAQYYSFDDIPTCDSGIKRHLDATCHNPL
jgi:uncharacterized membrane protein